MDVVVDLLDFVANLGSSVVIVVVEVVGLVLDFSTFGIAIA